MRARRALKRTFIIRVTEILSVLSYKTGCGVQRLKGVFHAGGKRIFITHTPTNYDLAGEG